MRPVEVIHEKLRRLAVEDPREARKTFLQLFDSGGSALEQFLGQVSSTLGWPAAAPCRQCVKEQSGQGAPRPVSHYLARN